MSEGITRKRLLKLQRYHCYLCGKAFAWWPPGTPDRRRLNRHAAPTLDHVRPKSRGHGRVNNKLFAHMLCNGRKGHREPYPCEVLFLDAINAMSGPSAIAKAEGATP